MALSGVFVGACVRVCLANPLSQSLEWKAEAHCWWKGERGLQAPDCGTEQQRFSPSLHSGRTLFSFMSLCSSVSVCHSHLSEMSLLLPDILHLSYLLRLFAYFFIPSCTFHSLPSPLPPSITPLGNLISPFFLACSQLIPVCMTDKYHITLSIWIHFGRILYTRPFTHFHTLNTIETCVCIQCRIKAVRKLDKRKWGNRLKLQHLERCFSNCV